MENPANRKRAPFLSKTIINPHEIINYIICVFRYYTMSLSTFKAFCCLYVIFKIFSLRCLGAALLFGLNPSELPGTHLAEQETKFSIKQYMVIPIPLRITKTRMEKNLKLRWTECGENLWSSPIPDSMV